MRVSVQRLLGFERRRHTPMASAVTVSVDVTNGGIRTASSIASTPQRPQPVQAGDRPSARGEPIGNRSSDVDRQ